VFWLPAGTTLSGTQVLLAGRLLPLLYASTGLVNAIVPYDLGPDSQYEVIVSNAGAISGPQMVTVAAAQPSIFKIDNSGAAQVAQDVWNRITSGTPADTTYAAPGTAIGAGDNIVIYWTGLGSVDQSIDPTGAAPSLVNTSNPVSVSFGGRAASPSFAGLAPGHAGLYQVNVAVPFGVTSGSGVPVTVSVAGQVSAPINVTARQDRSATCFRRSLSPQA
jgi:uncharacterized protein (TIGR03437 family)